MASRNGRYPPRSTSVSDHDVLTRARLETMLPHNLEGNALRSMSPMRKGRNGSKRFIPTSFFGTRYWASARPMYAGAWRRPESEPCVDARSPRRKFRRRRVMSGTPPTSVARMWRRPFRVIRDIAGPDRASMGDESTRTGGPRGWRRAVLRTARPIAADLRPRARTKDRESVLSLPWSGYSTVFSSENQCGRIQ